MWPGRLRMGCWSCIPSCHATYSCWDKACSTSVWADTDSWTRESPGISSKRTALFLKRHHLRSVKGQTGVPVNHYACREAIFFVSDHWENFRKTNHQLSSTTLQRLQVEYDQVFCRATSALLSAQRSAVGRLFSTKQHKDHLFVPWTMHLEILLLLFLSRLGSWQFMADLPYNCVSMPMMWTLLWLMHHGYKDKCDVTSCCSEQQCQTDLQGSFVRLARICFILCAF